MRRRSVADELRADDRARVSALTPAERVRLALELGARCLALRAARSGGSPEEVAIEFQRRRQARRRPSRCLEELIG
ncbi:MAG: hypothetical protein QNK04_18015 [Myxococcota bacterium]|nr:hypothetical protein [Myxococcota bacterium]